MLPVLPVQKLVKRQQKISQDGRVKMNKVGLALAAALLAYSSAAHAEFDRVKIGVLTDLSGFYEIGDR